MCFKDTLDTLRAEGIDITPTQLRWAINSGKIPRPRLDRSLSFDFGPEHVAELLAYFRNRKARTRPCEMVA